MMDGLRCRASGHRQRQAMMENWEEIMYHLPVSLKC